MTPDRRRTAVSRLQAEFEVSERRACRVAGQHRSTQRRPKKPVSASDAAYRLWLRELAREHPRWWCRKAHDAAVGEGLAVNPKRTRAYWRDEGLQRPP